MSIVRRAIAEVLGTMLFLATVIGSGVMAAKLSSGNDALALLCNALPIGAVLVALIQMFGPASGAHFNPALSIAFALRRELTWNAAKARLKTVEGVNGRMKPKQRAQKPRGKSTVSIRRDCFECGRDAYPILVRHARMRKPKFRAYLCCSWRLISSPSFATSFSEPACWRAIRAISAHRSRH